MNDATPKEARAESAAEESKNASLIAEQARLKAQEALIEKVFEKFTKAFDGRVKKLEDWQGEHTQLFKNLATKEDTDRILSVFTSFKIAATVGKWGYRTIIVVAGLVLAITAIIIGLKATAAAFIGWATINK